MIYGVNYTAIAGNPIYIEWACFSAKTAKTFMPDIRASLYTNRPAEVKGCKWSKFIDDILPAPDYDIEDWQGAMIDGILASEELGYDATLFTGADTVICDDVSDVLDLMATGKYDLALTLARDQRKRRYPLRGVHSGFPYYKDGALFFPWNDAVRKFMEDWREAFHSHKVECKKSRKPGARMHPTMPPLQEALYQNNNLRLVFLTDNYNTQFWTGCLYGKAKIVHVHGAGAKKSWEIAKKLNRNWQEPRIFKNRKIIG